MAFVEKVSKFTVVEDRDMSPAALAGWNSAVVSGLIVAWTKTFSPHPAC